MEVTQDVLNRIYPFSQLPAEAIDQLKPSMRIRWYRPGSDLFTFGDSPEDHFYVLEGSVWLVDEKEEKFQTVGANETIPLPYVLPSIHRARTTHDAKLLLVDRTKLMDVLRRHQPEGAQTLEHSYQQRILDASPLVGTPPTRGVATEDWQAAFLRAPGVKRIALKDLRKVFELMNPVSLKRGDIVIAQGDPADFFYIVAEGRVEVLRDFSKGSAVTRVAEYGPGATLGEDALITGNLRNATVRMLTDGKLMRLDGDDFRFLIKRALVRGVEVHEAKGMVARGSQLLDVRMPEERKAGELPGATQIPHPIVRGRLFTADPQVSYVVVCAKGFDSPSITFTLCKYGFDAYYLKGGYAALAAAKEPVAKGT